MLQGQPGSIPREADQRNMLILEAGASRLAPAITSKETP